MKIIFLTHYFPPEVNAPATRTFEHCREWVKSGHQVTVITCFPNHPYGRIYPGYRHRLWQKEQIDGIDVIRVGTYLAANEGFLLRTLNFVSYMGAASIASIFAPKSDVVISTSPQFFCGLAGFIASRLKGVPWVLEVRDLWPDSIVAVGAMREGRLIRLLSRMEAWAYRKADRIVSVTESFKEHIEARAGAGHKVAVVKNGVDLDSFATPRPDPELRRKLGLEGKFVAAYVGTHGMAHGLEVVLEAAALLRDEPDIAFLLVGEGAEAQRLRAMREEAGLANVVMLGQQPRELMPALWALTDAALVLLRRSEVFKTVIPSKLLEAMGTGRPVVLGVEGEAKAILEGTGCGIAIEPENAAQLADAVRRLARDPDLARELGANGRICIERDYDRRVLADRLASVLASVVAQRHAKRGSLAAGRSAGTERSHISTSVKPDPRRAPDARR